MKANLRPSLIIAGIGAAVVVAIIVQGLTETGKVVVSAADGGSLLLDASLDLQHAERRMGHRSLPSLPDDPFSPRATHEPLPPATAPVAVVTEPPPPRPTAPPVPFRYVGRVSTSGGADTVFVRLDNRLIAVQVGETVSEHYRIDNLGIDSIGITYLPLQEAQRISIR